MPFRHSLISYYLIKEVFSIFFIGLLVFIFLFLIGKMFEIARLMVTHHVGIIVILKLLLYTIPYFLSIIIPTVAFMSPLLTTLRMSHDKEYIALKASGINPIRLFPPVIFFGSVCMVFTLFITSFGIPLGSGAARDLIFHLVRKDVEMAIKPGIFYDRLPRLIVYVENIKDDGLLEGVFLYNSQDKKTIIAQSGYISKGKLNFVFNLKRGYILQDKGENQFGILSFETYNFSFNFPKNIGRRRKNPKEYTPWQLWKRIKRNEGDKTAFILALNRKLSLPFAAFIFPILGTCLGLIQFKRIPSGGIILAIFFFILYQICFSAAISLGKANILPPQIGPWLPNIGLLIAIVYLFRRLLHE